MGEENRSIFPIIGELAWELLFNSDSDSDEEEYEIRRAKNKDFWEKTIPRFDSKQFKCHFRITPETFQNLYRGIVLLNVQSVSIRRGRLNIELEKKTLITILYLSNTECYRSVADRFGVSIKACWTVVHAICFWSLIETKA